MRQQMGAAPEVPWRSRPPLSRNAVARLVQIAGAFDALTAILPPRHRPLTLLIELVPAAGVLSARAATGVVGLLLIYLGAGLRRGKRRAWQVAVGLAALSVVLRPRPVARATVRHNAGGNANGGVNRVGARR